MLYDDFMSEDLITAIFHKQSVELDFHQLSFYYERTNKVS